MNIVNVNRTVKRNEMSGLIARKYGYEGLPEDTIHIKFNGSAGQSFGAWLAKARSLSWKATRTITWARDSRAERLRSPPKKSTFKPEEKHHRR